MADVTLTAANIRPLNGAIIRRALAGEALAFGDSVYVSSYTGDLPVVSKTDGNGALGLTRCYGVVVSTQSDTNGATTVASGAGCDVVTFGPVAGFLDAPTGAHVWISDNAGLIATAVSGTHSCIVGVAESPKVILVRPFAGTASS